MKISKSSLVFGALLVGTLSLAGFLAIQHRSKAPTTETAQYANDKVGVTTTSKNSTKTTNLKLLFIGDIMLARSIGQKILAGQNPFEFVQPTFNKYNLRIANVETTIANPGVASQAQGKLFTFNAPLKGVDVLKNAGIDVALLANNHTRDFGSPATADMVSRLKAAGFSVGGAGKNIDQAFTPVVASVPLGKTGGYVNVAFVALNSIENSYTNATSTQAGSAYFDKALVGAEIKQAKKLADVVVVFPHWGVEYQTTPNAFQSTWGHYFIDEGADIVIGSHPHVVQPTEKYKGKYIVYSMGNFVFDQMTGNSAIGQMIDLGLNVTASYDSSGKIIAGSKKVKLSAPKSIPTLLDSSGFPHLR